LEEIKITLQGQLPHIAVEAEVAAPLKLVIGIIFIGITKLGKLSAYPNRDIITELLSEKHPESQFGPVDLGRSVQIAKIMRGAQRKANFPLMSDRFHLCPGCRMQHDYTQNGQDEFLHNAI